MSKPEVTTTRLDDAARAGWLYYVAGNTQDEIAAKLGISRQSAQRMVSLAVSEGLVKVRLDHPIARCLDLAEQLKQRFGLKMAKSATPVPSPGPPTVTSNSPRQPLLTQMCPNPMPYDWLSTQGLALIWRASRTRVAPGTSHSCRDALCDAHEMRVTFAPPPFCQSPPPPPPRLTSNSPRQPSDTQITRSVNPYVLHPARRGAHLADEMRVRAGRDRALFPAAAGALTRHLGRSPPPPPPAPIRRTSNSPRQPSATQI